MYIFLIFIFINIIIISCYSTYSVDRITTPIMLLVLHILLIDIFPFSELNSIFHAPQHPLSCLYALSCGWLLSPSIHCALIQTPSPIHLFRAMITINDNNYTIFQQTLAFHSILNIILFRSPHVLSIPLPCPSYIRSYRTDS